ncbi:hypothetical protein HWV62_27693 [Athelia sp. TMB]|nr:hypothetical protein HWV62_27693 [Athelia sp. TMB]
MSDSLVPSPSFSALECMREDDYAAADAARQRLAPKKGLRGLSHSLSNLRRDRTKSVSSKKTSRSANDGQDEGDITRPSVATTVAIDLDGSAISGFHLEKDIYRWATIYENQRGFTMFSTPYYSKMTLLPMDPLPFTIPSSSSKRSKQPKVSLTEYPLPDGTWRWVSKCWMIDMRSDSGEVQHDGFEYNWRFRPEKWTADIGGLSAGGLVRRRRWVRLMMRPATIPAKVQTGLNPSRSEARNSTYSDTSGIPSITNDDADAEAESVWTGDAEQDWIRCHTLMKRLGRDGRKLEQWKRWLGGYYCEHLHLGHLIADGKQKKQWSEDEGLLPSQLQEQRPDSVITEGKPPTFEHIANVLRLHGDDLLHSFVYPDSRAKLLELLGHGGLLPELNVPLGIGWSAADVDFWSYASGLDKTVAQDDAALEAKEKEAERNDANTIDAYTEVEAGEATVPSTAPSTAKNVSLAKETPTKKETPFTKEAPTVAKWEVTPVAKREVTPTVEEDPLAKEDAPSIDGSVD